MTIVNGYVDRATFKEYIAFTGTQNDTLIDQAISAASRAVDNHCDRRFWLDATPVTRTFVPTDLFNLIDLPDIGDSTGLVVKTDPGGDGTFSVIWSTGDFQLLPQNAPHESPEAKPWTALRAVGAHTFPWLTGVPLGRRKDRVSISAKWGWPAVPDAVVQATLIKASRLYHRKDSPQGVAGFGEFGPIRISRTEDPDVAGLLDDDYKRGPVLIA